MVTKGGDGVICVCACVCVCVCGDGVCVYYGDVNLRQVDRCREPYVWEQPQHLRGFPTPPVKCRVNT